MTLSTLALLALSSEFPFNATEKLITDSGVYGGLINDCSATKIDLSTHLTGSLPIKLYTMKMDVRFRESIVNLLAFGGDAHA